MAIKAIFASVQDIGKTVKKTKKHYVWKFNIDGRDHILELFTSMISGKKKIMIDGRIIFEGQKVLSSHFTYPVEVDRQTVNIYQHGEKYDVLINGQPFAQLYAGQGRDYGYDDVGSHGHSYGFSKSVTSKMGDKYNKDKGLRNNLERDEYATRAKYDGNRYYTNDEKIDSWNDVDRKMSHRRREEQHGYSERSDSAEDREENYTDFSRHPVTKSKTFGATNNFHESENRQRHAHHHHNSKSQMSRPSSHFESQGSFDNFSGFDKENQPAPPNRTQQKGFTQPPKSTNTQDFFDLDAAEKRTEQPKSQNQTVNHQDFFNFGATSTTSTVQQKEEPKPTPPTIHKQHSMPAPVTTNDLIDFGGPSISTITELYKLSPQTNQTIEFPTSTTTTVNAANTSINNAVQLKAEPEKPKSDPAKKGDLWSSDLVSLGDISNKPQTNNNKQPEFINFTIPQAGSNTMSTNNNNMSNMNTMNMMNSNNNMGMMNNMNMNNMSNMGMMNTNFGQPNMMPGMGFNTNMGMGMGMNMNMGGYGNMGMNQGMGMGGMYNGYVNNANYF